MQKQQKNQSLPPKQKNSAGVSVVGMIVALVCNLAFLKAILGFFLGAIFFVASIIYQAIFVNKAFFSAEDAGLDERVLSDFKRKVINLAEMSIGLTVAFLGFTFPLILVDAYMGLGSDSLLIWGAMGASAFLLFYAILLYFLNASLLRKGVYSLSEQESVIHCHNHKLKSICALVLVVFLMITGIGHHVSTSIWGPYSIMEGTTFEDYDSFIEYMEQDVPAEPKHSFNAGTTAVEIPVPSEGIGTSTYYDAYGNVISLRYTPKDGTILPITVCTEDDLRESRQTAAIRHAILGAAYCFECLAIVLIYFKKRMK